MQHHRTPGVDGFYQIQYNTHMMKRNDKIQLIIEHMVNQGIEDSDGFVEYLQDLLGFSDSELDSQLAILEALAE